MSIAAAVMLAAAEQLKAGPHIEWSALGAVALTAWATVCDPLKRRVAAPGVAAG